MNTHAARSAVWLAAIVGSIGLGCSPFSSKPKETKSAPTAQLVEANPDIASRDLFYGVGGKSRAPDPKVQWRFLERDESGVSTNFDLEDPQGRKWDAKFGAEVKTEIAVSRLLWAIGFHQPPVYYVREWRIGNGPEAGVQPEARFRLEEGWKKDGTWEWKDNPFVGTRELHGLVVMMAMLNAWDLKTSNNAIYHHDGKKLFVVKDLGDAFGKSAQVFLGTLDDPKDFEREKFIRGVKDDGRVDLHFRPVMMNWGLEDDITVDDVLWTCRRLDRLSDRQWRDAFRAAGYSDAEGAAYVKRLQAKVREGLALADAPKT